MFFFRKEIIEEQGISFEGMPSTSVFFTWHESWRFAGTRSASWLHKRLPHPEKSHDSRGTSKACVNPPPCPTILQGTCTVYMSWHTILGILPNPIVLYCWDPHTRPPCFLCVRLDAWMDTFGDLCSYTYGDDGAFIWVIPWAQQGSSMYPVYIRTNRMHATLIESQHFTSRLKNPNTPWLEVWLYRWWDMFVFVKEHCTLAWTTALR